MADRRPTPEDLARAAGRRLRDVIAPRLDVLFVGINPGLWSAATGHHFARPGNRFWPTLHGAGFTPRLLAPHEEWLLPTYGCGVTNLVARATASAAELGREELVRGGRALARKVRRFEPRFVALLGVTAYRAAFEQPRGCLGAQDRAMGGATLWVLPNPSGLNAHHQLPQLIALFATLRTALER